MPLTLSLASDGPPGIEAEGLRPDALARLCAADVARLPLWVGNRTSPLAEFFTIDGDPSDGHLIFEGDFRRTSGLGQGMKSGRLTIRGSAGAHVGAGMVGGTIEVEGSVGDWAGAEMRGGLLKISGSAGDSLGSAYPGSRLGMRGGAILVAGDVGCDAGLSMRRGLIAVGGRAGDGLGRAMIAGSVFAFGPVGAHLGAGMKRGTLALFGPKPELLPTFRSAGRWRPHFMNIYLSWLRDRGAEAPDEAFRGGFEKFSGDLVGRGQGEILVWDHRAVER
jgi:formylmethanofuran dehydrogenase subunit C